MILSLRRLNSQAKIELVWQIWAKVISYDYNLQGFDIIIYQTSANNINKSIKNLEYFI